MPHSAGAGAPERAWERTLAGSKSTENGWTMEVLVRGSPQLLRSHFSSIETTTPVKLSLLRTSQAETTEFEPQELKSRCSGPGDASRDTECSQMLAYGFLPEETQWVELILILFHLTLPLTLLFCLIPPST